MCIKKIHCIDLLIEHQSGTSTDILQADMVKLDSILLVDDDQATNFINTMLIEDMGIAKELLIALNGQEALEIISKRCLGGTCPDLILLDINMPVMNGFEFLEAYKNLGFAGSKSVVIVMLTTSLNTNDLAKVPGTNTSRFLNKPLTEEALNDILQTHFAQHLPN